MNLKISDARIGYAMTGSFCTMQSSVRALEELTKTGAIVTPIMSETVYNTDTRFGNAADFISKSEQLCGRSVIHTIKDAEPIGPKHTLDLLIVAPCTGNTLGKLANGITDTAVTMAVKAHLRNEAPVLLSIATNDALGASGKNIMQLLNCKNIFIVPFKQDDPINKRKSLISDMSLICRAAENALEGIQLQPILL